ncbi:hypothetical protein B0H16DRAFT_1464410 [Mycena metata]|uniref:Uncharacterized protein n=1 Tax=Mycena metata TaxID=1033252 RepID=A0AAD7IGD9_9AGAR|nr:hypothetical protein B0H16DRAFT_1464410 [Mycena metata]
MTSDPLTSVAWAAATDDTPPVQPCAAPPSGDGGDHKEGHDNGEGHHRGQGQGPDGSANGGGVNSNDQGGTAGGDAGAVSVQTYDPGPSYADPSPAAAAYDPGPSSSYDPGPSTYDSGPSYDTSSTLY